MLNCNLTFRIFHLIKISGAGAGLKFIKVSNPRRENSGYFRQLRVLIGVSVGAAKVGQIIIGN